MGRGFDDRQSRPLPRRTGANELVERTTPLKPSVSTSRPTGSATTPAPPARYADALRRALYLPFGSGAYILRWRLEGNTVVVIRV
jgi:hypothetical protein